MYDANRFFFFFFFLPVKRGYSDNKSTCEYNYIFVSNLGSNNELREEDTKGSYPKLLSLCSYVDMSLCWVHL